MLDVFGPLDHSRLAPANSADTDPSWTEPPIDTPRLAPAFVERQSRLAELVHDREELHAAMADLQSRMPGPTWLRCLRLLGAVEHAAHMEAAIELDYIVRGGFDHLGGAQGLGPAYRQLIEHLRRAEACPSGCVRDRTGWH